MNILRLDQLVAQGRLAGQRVFIRADLNVPQDDAGNITEDTRIRASVPCVEQALKAGAAVMVTSHLGRPTEGQFKPEDSLAPVAARMAELLGREVPLVADWIGQPWAETVTVESRAKVESLLRDAAGPPRWRQVNHPAVGGGSDWPILYSTVQISPPGPVVGEKQLAYWVGLMKDQEMLKTVPKVDLPRFMGDWYVFAHIPYSLEKGKVVLTDEKGGKATVTTTDLKGSNGVIHVIDHVLLPK